MRGKLYKFIFDYCNNPNYNEETLEVIATNHYKQFMKFSDYILDFKKLYKHNYNQKKKIEQYLF